LDRPATFSEKIFNVLWQMRKNGYAEATIEGTDRRLKMMANAVDLDDPEAVKEYIASKDGKSSYKEGLVKAYNLYARYNRIYWENHPTDIQANHLTCLQKRKS